jgi:alpha-tubulin suppressor-like RCC1 family protein
VSGGADHSLFLKNDGTVWACGSNGFGQLGDGTYTSSSTPIQVSSLTGITSMAAGVGFSLFVKNDGTVWACGCNFSGQLGDGTITGKLTPVLVSSITGITIVAAGGNHSLFLKNNGMVWACGSNSNGQLGDGTNIDKTTPVQVNSLVGITAAAIGWNHSLFLKNDGTMWACGSNSYGQLGDSTTIDKTQPIQVSGLCTIITSMDEQQQLSNVLVFPNPTRGIFKIMSNGLRIKNIEIYNILGEKVYEILNDRVNGVNPLDQQVNPSITLNLYNQPNGIYLIQLKTSQGCISKKIIYHK